MATSNISGGPSRLPMLPVMEYLEASPTTRRRGSRKSCRSVQLLVETPLSLYADPSITQSQRSNLVKAVMADLASSECTWDVQDRISALKMVREMSRLPGSSETLGLAEALQCLVSLTRREVLSTEGLDLLLRVLNNVLLQHSHSRQTFASSTIGGMQLSLDLIEKINVSSITFLAARLVFFSTLYEAEITKQAVETWRLVEIFSRRTEELLQDTITPETDLALAELQKAFFNVGLYYPRLASNNRQGRAIVGESFHETLLPFLTPTLQLVISHPSQTPTSLAPPLTNAIAVLLNYPVATYKSIWSGTRHISKGSNGSEDTCSSSRSSSASSKAKRMASSLFGKASPSPSPPSSLGATFKTTFNGTSRNDFLTTLVDLLDEFLQKYFTTLDPDDSQADTLAAKDGIDLQDYAEPALLLCRRLVDEVAEFRRTVKSRILPNDIDRSVGLDMRRDLTGTLIRLMSSSNFSRLARASGEVLLALCDGQPSKMTTEIGYGPCAGFLTQIGHLNSFPGAPTSNGTGQLIDPVTGKVMPSAEEMAREDEAAGLTMTEEEKEAEAEKLFSLFDRMDRTGVIKVQNPLKQAVDSGRFHEMDEKEEELEKKRVEEEDNELETTVEREMKAFRLKQKRVLEETAMSTEVLKR